MVPSPDPMKQQPDTGISRQEFLKLVTGVMAGLSIPGIATAAVAPKAGNTRAAPLDDAYLERGLTAMARAETWFDAHWGAGILAGYYLCRDHPLDAVTIAGIRKQMDTVIAVRGKQFAPLEDGRAERDLIEEVPTALSPAIEGGLRAHGHAVIFASLATRALRDAPEMARPKIVEPLCGLSRQIAKGRPQKPDASAQGYVGTQTMIEATFDSLARFRPLLGHPEVRRPNFTHMITHTEALMNLELMGYADLARSGHLGHRTHIGAPVPAVSESAPAGSEKTTLERVMSGTFWTDAVNTDHWKVKWNQTTNPNGDWIASGHLFKVLYSFHRLMSRIRDADKVRLVSAILLERYVNPAVQGG